jgi:branched-chain amino acid transport system ATP-binding protein
MVEVRGLTVRFGGQVAVDDVSLKLPSGEVTGVIGPNGAGKTTLFNVICGYQRPSAGTVLLDGHDVTRVRPEIRASHGLARTFQRLELFGALTVRENLRVAASMRRASSAIVERRCDEMLARLDLESVADQPSGALSTGVGRLVELGRALITEPRALLLDEPASGQDEDETRRLDEILGEVAGAGVAVGLVEHDIHLVMRICHRIHVLDHGCVIAFGSPDEVRANSDVQAAYLGAAI